jgi:hypothetical protein
MANFWNHTSYIHMFVGSLTITIAICFIVFLALYQVSYFFHPRILLTINQSSKMWIRKTTGKWNHPMTTTPRAFLSKVIYLPSGKRLHNYGKSPFLKGKSTVSMAIFNSCVKFPEGTTRDSRQTTTRGRRLTCWKSRSSCPTSLCELKSLGTGKNWHVQYENCLFIYIYLITLYIYINGLVSSIFHSYVRLSEGLQYVDFIIFATQNVQWGRIRVCPVFKHIGQNVRHKNIIIYSWYRIYPKYISSYRN